MLDTGLYAPVVYDAVPYLGWGAGPAPATAADQPHSAVPHPMPERAVGSGGLPLWGLG